MAAMPFRCNGILVVVGNLTMILPMSSMIYASFLILYINLCKEHLIIWIKPTASNSVHGQQYCG